VSVSQKVNNARPAVASVASGENASRLNASAMPASTSACHYSAYHVRYQHLPARCQRRRARPSRDSKADVQVAGRPKNARSCFPVRGFPKADDAVAAAVIAVRPYGKKPTAANDYACALSFQDAPFRRAG